MTEPAVYREVWDPTLDLRVCAQCGIPVGAEPCPEHAPKVLTFFERLDEAPLLQHVESVRRRAGTAWRATGTVWRGTEQTLTDGGSRLTAGSARLGHGLTAATKRLVHRVTAGTARLAVGLTAVAKRLAGHLTAAVAQTGRGPLRPVSSWFAAAWLAVRSRATFLPVGFRVRTTRRAHNAKHRAPED